VQKHLAGAGTKISLVIAAELYFPESRSFFEGLPLGRKLALLQQLIGRIAGVASQTQAIPIASTVAARDALFCFP
jgi:hypothetical protein